MKKSRDANIELLRILAMLFIVSGHVLGDDLGGVLRKTDQYSLAWYLLWALHAFCVAGTNIYVLISGYYLCKSDASWKKTLKTAAPVWFYSIAFFVLAVALKETTVSPRNLFKAITPILGRHYWFVSTYIALYVLSPFLNIAIRAMNKETLQRLILTLLLLFSVIPTFYPFVDSFAYGGGGGIIWFLTLYTIASYIRLYGIEFKRWSPAYSYFLLVAVIILSKYMITAITDSLLGYSVGTSLFYSNNSILNLCASTLLFLAFLKLDINGSVSKSICAVSRVTFGVYLIHNNVWLRDAMWRSIAPKAVGENPFLLLIHVLSLAVAIYAVSGMIEFIRQLIFDKAAAIAKRK